MAKGNAMSRVGLATDRDKLPGYQERGEALGVGRTDVPDPHQIDIAERARPHAEGWGEASHKIVTVPTRLARAMGLA
jgi:hypothetical protein